MSDDEISDGDYFENMLAMLDGLTGEDRWAALAAIDDELRDGIAAYAIQAEQARDREAAAAYEAQAQGFRATLARVEALAALPITGARRGS